jgi:hypothetical protein
MRLASSAATKVGLAFGVWPRALCCRLQSAARPPLSHPNPPTPTAQTRPPAPPPPPAASPRSSFRDHNRTPFGGAGSSDWSGSDDLDSSSEFAPDGLATSSLAGRLVSCLSIMRHDASVAGDDPNARSPRGFPTPRGPRPPAGSSFQRRMEGQDRESSSRCWDEADATTFHVRSTDYMRTKVGVRDCGDLEQLAATPWPQSGVHITTHLIQSPSTPLHTHQHPPPHPTTSNPPGQGQQRQGHLPPRRRRHLQDRPKGPPRGAPGDAAPRARPRARRRRRAAAVTHIQPAAAAVPRRVFRAVRGRGRVGGEPLFGWLRFGGWVVGCRLSLFCLPFSSKKPAAAQSHPPSNQN